MTWDAVALPHLGHRTVLKTVREIRCHDCQVTLLIPRDPNAPTPQPPRFRPYRGPRASEEAVAAAKAQAAAALAAARARRTTQDPA